MNAPVEPGQLLANKYRVERVLGEGGMGVVVAAVDVNLERRVAIKFLLPQYAEHREASARFMREARAAVKIQSEHIARVIDVNTMSNGSPYMVMQFLEGCDLAQHLEKSGPLPIEDAVSHVLQASDAIAEAHAYGIVHRDLKPANLFLAKQPDGSERIKVLDFGISKNTVAAAEGTDPSLTRTSSMMGSPLYMSPEQMRSTKDVDARTDIWALGVILYELLTARIPFNAGSIPELSAMILLDPPAPMSRADVPPELEQVVMRALAKDPNARFPSIAEFSIALSPFAPKRTRANVERISKLLVSAGLSDSAVSLPESVAPAAALDRTAVARATTGNDTEGATRPGSGTLGEWGKTNGPEPSPKSVGKWVASGVAAAALLVGGVLFALQGGTEDQVGAAEAPPTIPTEESSPAERSETAPTDAEPASPSGAPSMEEAASLADESDESDQDEQEEAQPTPSATAVGRKPAPPPRSKPAPRPVKKAPAPPPKKKSSSGSLRDQFGGRK